MKDRITIEWQISDGYIGCMRTQNFLLRLNEFECCANQEEIISYIMECVKDDFDQKISYKVQNLDNIVRKIEKYLDECEEE